MGAPEDRARLRQAAQERREAVKAWEQAPPELRRLYATYRLDWRPTAVQDEPPSYLDWAAERELDAEAPWEALIGELAAERAAAPAEDLRASVKRESEREP